ncbi:MAG: TRAP transporter substrate-binding protein DctP [Nitrospirae bacterium]|nr:TRAP transporter substrate-binding protein DctP [Nitrospirota bacterium]
MLIRGIPFCLLLAALFASSVPPSHAQAPKPEVTLRWGSLAPQGTAYTDSMEMWKKRLEEKSKGRIKNILFMGGVVGDEPDMIKKLRIGQLDVGGFTMKGTFSALNELTVFGLPFLLEDNDEADYVMLSLFNEIDALMDKKGFKLIGLVEEGFDLPYSKNKIELPEGFRGQRVWNWSTEPVGMATFKALGVESPIQTPVPEVLPSLQTGLLNVVTASPLAAVGMQWSTQVKYVYDMNLYYDPGVVLINNSSWNKMPADLQQVFLDTSSELSDYFFQLERPDQERSMEAMLKHGIQLVKPDPAALQVLKNKTQPVWDELADKVYPKSLLEKILVAKKQWAEMKSKGVAKPPRKRVVVQRVRIK